MSKKKWIKKILNNKENEMEIVFWNAAGQNTISSEEWKELRKSDIINLTETWIEKEEDRTLKTKLENYITERTKARRENRKGRAKGGMVTAYNKKLKRKIKTEKINEEVTKIEIEEEENKIIIVSVYMREKRKENYEKLSEIIEENKEKSIILGGDFNARTALKGGKIEEEDNSEGRRSEDKILNEEGKELVEWMQQEGMYILNGNTRGRENEKMTYIGAAGKSVIDYIIVNKSGEEIIEEFNLVDNTSSDHLMLKIKINNCTEGLTEEEEERERRNKDKNLTVWNEESIREYKEKTGKELEGENWNELKNRIKQYLPMKTVRYKTKDEEKWWDKECHQAKQDLKKIRKLYRENEVEKKEYLEARREYRILIDRKKEEHKEEEWKAAKEDKTGKKFWNLVNRQRKRRNNIDEEITMEEWTEHFKKQFDGKLTKPGKKNKESKTYENEIELEEIKKVIKEMKKKKAPGSDQIPNEAWIYASEKSIEKLHEIINKIWKGEQDFPEEWKTGIVTPIYKKGDEKRASNYRGITLMDSGYKIYAEVLRRRLESELETKNILKDTQMGYRKGKGTIEAIYIVKSAVEEEIKKEKGKAHLLFADMKGAFDKLNRDMIWKQMEKYKIDKQLIERTKDIYEETSFKIKANGKISESIYTENGVRQGCPLSTALFNLAFANLEEHISKEQEGGIVIGNRKIWTVSYADDVVLMASNKAGLDKMSSRFRTYIGRRNLELNTEKTKYMVAKKRGGKSKEGKMEWDGKTIEEVKDFNYLGYTLQQNNGNEAHIKNMVKKARIVLGKVWGIAERNFRENWKKRIFIFEVLVESILMYGVEIWGWQEHSEIERIQDKYIKWTLKLNRTTPGYMIRAETKRHKISIKTGKRAIRFEEKILKKEEEDILKQCVKIKSKILKEKQNGTGKTYKTTEKWKKERRKFLENIGWSLEYYDRHKIQSGEDPGKQAEEIKLCEELQHDNDKLGKSKYAAEYRQIAPLITGKPAYLERERNGKKELETRARYRLGTEARANYFWLNESLRKCRLCRTREETMKHIFEECEVTGRNENWTRQLSKEKSLARLLEINWIRKRHEEERAGVTEATT